MKTSCDIAIIGAGFAGALTALGLHQIGYHVILIEKDTHPRFAIGESSTPIADMILRDLSEQYDLPWLHDFSRYGSWQQTFPEISCGLKRGFSYYRHQKGEFFQTGELHQNELLVAASRSDHQSDTHWYRSETDAFFVKKVQEYGIPYYDKTDVTGVTRSSNRWDIRAFRNKEQMDFRADWLIDATGTDRFLDVLGLTGSNYIMNTRTSAIYSHFDNVKPWQNWLLDHGISNGDYPYNPDHSALHHLLDEGWMWMLGFNNGITSAGFVFRENPSHRKTPEKTWNSILERYPSLKSLFKQATLAGSPGRLIQTSRLQRISGKLTRDGYVALPHTAGFIDPLNSTGIAHSLSGVERILHAFSIGRSDKAELEKQLQKYEKGVLQELRFIDLLISGCYTTMSHFELFHVFNMLYFTAAIAYEQNRLQGGFDVQKHLFLSAGHPDITRFTRHFHRKLHHILKSNSVSGSDIKNFRKSVRRAIEPFNSAGLLNPDIPNMYEHTAAEI